MLLALDNGASDREFDARGLHDRRVDLYRIKSAR